MSHPQQRYQIVRKLGQAQPEGRIAYLAQDSVTQQMVIIKEFPFAKIDAQWAGCEAYTTAVKGLMKLQHPGIPRYLAAFPIEDGLCTVQEYKQTQPLSELNAIEPAQIKQIAVALLEILVYLQNQNPPVIHRNIKPENVQVDGQYAVYLMDFGFDYLGREGEVKTSVAGTAGFMPQEQLRDRDSLSEATDLFAVGMTLSCLLTQTPTTDVETLNSQSGELNIANKVSKVISLQWIEWLNTMTRPYPIQRFPNAAAALESLHHLDATCVPKAILRPDRLELTATTHSEKLTETIVVVNSTPDTLLEGQWSIAPHPSEPLGQYGFSTWISFEPSSFQQNQIECQITVNTSKLVGNRTYERQLILKANTATKHHTVDLQVQTVARKIQNMPMVPLGIVWLISIAVGRFGGLFCGDMGTAAAPAYIALCLGMLPGFVGGSAMAFGAMQSIKYTVGVAIILVFLNFIFPYYTGVHTLVGYIIGFIAALSAGYVTRYHFGKPKLKHFWGMLEGMLSNEGYISTLTAILGIAMGIGLKEGLFNRWIVPVLLITGIPLIVLLLVLHKQNAKVMAAYLKSQQRLIQP